MEEELTYVTFKKPKKEKKPPTESQLKEKLRKKCVDKAKEISKIRDGYQCRYIDKDGKRCLRRKEPNKRVHSHHIFHEGLNKAMSADVDNLITLCVSHHQGGMWMKSHDNFNFHNSPAESTEWLRENWPNYDELKQRSMKSELLTMQFWENKLKELKTYETKKNI